MSSKNRIMDVTVALISAYMQSINTTEANIYKQDAEEYAAFIETVYKKVEALTSNE